MTAIKSEISTDKKSKEVIYSFQVNNETFKAYLVPPRKTPTLHIQHNGATLGTILWEVDKNRKFEYVVNANAEPITITAWIDSDSNNKGSRKSIGIEVNGVPVQHTLSDPQTIQKKKLESRCAILLAIVFMIVPFGPFQQAIKAIDLPAIYFAPFLIGIIAAAIYKSWAVLAIFSDIYLLILEIRHIIEIGTFSNSYIVIWFLIRIGILCALLYILKQEREQKKANLSQEIKHHNPTEVSQ